MPNVSFHKKLFRLLKSSYWLIVPALLFYMLFWFVPVTISIIQSFSAISSGFTFDNYLNMFREPLFNRALINTLVFAVVSLLIQFVLAVLLALLINRRFKGSRLFLFVVIIPMALPQAAVGILWNTGFMEFGWINSLLEVLGIQELLLEHNIIERPILWKSSTGMRAVMTIVAIDTWTVLPSVMIIILAGLQNFNDELKEASYVFGATKFQATKDIVIPIIKPAIITALLLRLISGLQVWLISVMIFGYGRVPYLLERVVYYTSVVSKTEANYKMAITYSVFVLVMILTIAFLFVRLTRGKDWRKANE